MFSLAGSDWAYYPFDISHALEAAARLVLIAGAAAGLLLLVTAAVISRVVWLWRVRHARRPRGVAAPSPAAWQRRHEQAGWKAQS